MTSEIDWKMLRHKAIEAAAHAYAPYSGFPVGAAALVDDHRMVAGCNVENVSYGLGLCAECAVVCALHSGGGGRLIALSCVDGAGEVLMPCGRCRQVLLEHGGPELLIDHPLGPRPLGELLPDAFGPEDLARHEEPHEEYRNSVTRFTFDAPTVIRTKRDGGVLSDAAIDWVIDAYTHGRVADEQMSALLMAIFLRGMTERRDRPVDGGDGGLGRAAGLYRSAPRWKATGVGGQAFHRRRRRQDHHPVGADRDGVRRCGAAGGRARARSYRRHARQAGVDRRVHRRTVQKPDPATALRSRCGDLRRRGAGAGRPQDLCAARRHRHHRVAAA